MAACFKRGYSSTPKNAAIAQENAALDAFYGRMFKMRPIVCALSRVFKKCGFSPSIATFLQMRLKKTRPKTHVFCSDGCYWWAKK